MSNDDTKLRWGILSTGRIAVVFAKAMESSKTGKVVAVASRDGRKAEEFAAGFDIPDFYGSYEELIDDPTVQAVYIATPHPQHAEWALRAIRAGKHVLCEKPLTMNHEETSEVATEARAWDVVVMEAYMYRCHPQTQRVLDLIRRGAIGRVGMVHATFGFDAPFSGGGRLWSKELGGGGILDVGGYTTSWARLVAGAVEGKPFLDPVEVHGSAIFHPETGVDTQAAANLVFPNGMLGQVSCSIGLGQENAVRLYGTEGWMWIPSPYIVNRHLEPSRIFIFKPGATKPEEILVTPDRPLYTYEADAFADAVRAGEREVAAMTLDDSLGNAAVLDQWLASARSRVDRKLTVL
ncbi:Gfo/Idh/MocA family oxidoreductase [Luteolibacter sp. LG18]|uniref:Gfo/Idh/MocA family protein n=1 Tax=Luteolibacter sp. LG18 TaxID=2819286 RepID=UPI002B2F932C|nr:oxidoreductase [Luteolibacter sp. LG18]